MKQLWTAQKRISQTKHSSSQSKQKNTSPVLVKEEHETIIRFAQISVKSGEVVTRDSLGKEKRQLAAHRARQKKKWYMKELKESVNHLGSQIERYDEELSTQRGRLSEALQSSHNQASEHSFIYSELERHALEDYPDLDRINLLIDIIRNRDGANGKERTANINYAFKQGINFIFPALYRYLLNTAYKETDFFCKKNSSTVDKPHNWAQELLKKMGFDDRQVQLIDALRERFRQMRKQASGHVRRLNQLNEAIKNQGFEFQQRLATLRNQLSAVQCAFLLVFADRYKYRKELSLQGEFDYDKTHKMLKEE